MLSKRIILSLAVVSVLAVAGIAWTELAHRPQEMVFRVDGMECPSCAARIGEELEKLPGTSEVAVSMENATVTLTVDGWSNTKRDDIKAVIEAAGDEFKILE
jgi:Cd2+/Zn2+-exporting ATPase